MKIIQYTMTVPKNKHKAFLKYAKKVLGPTWKKYGCKRHEVCRVIDKKIMGRQIAEKNRFVERLYFADDFDIAEFYKQALGKALEKTRSYEEKFGASDIELRILEAQN